MSYPFCFFWSKREKACIHKGFGKKMLDRNQVLGYK